MNKKQLRIFGLTLAVLAVAGAAVGGGVVLYRRTRSQRAAGGLPPSPDASAPRAPSSPPSSDASSPPAPSGEVQS